MSDAVDAASLVGEISSSVKDQSTGTREIMNSVLELDKVTQLNAASAQESAASGTELVEQAAKAQRLIRGLESLIYGSSGAAT